MTQPEPDPATACPPPEDVRACALGRLPEGWALLLLQHVESCSLCRQLFDQFLCRPDDLLPNGK